MCFLCICRSLINPSEKALDPGEYPSLLEISWGKKAKGAVAYMCAKFQFKLKGGGVTGSAKISIYFVIVVH